MEEAWTPPLSAPSITEPPYEMTAESEFIYVFYDVSTDILAEEVPPPLTVAPESEAPRVRACVGDAVQPPHTSSYYHEGIVAVKVQFEDMIGWYCPYIWTHSDEAMDAGRLYGINKQICDDTPLRNNGDQYTGEVRRYDDLLFRITFRYNTPPPGRRETSLEDAFADLMGGGLLGLKKVASPERNGKVLKQVIYTELEDVSAPEIWGGDAAVEFAPNAKYPRMHKLEPENQPEDIHSAFYVRPNFILPHGEVVWDSYERPDGAH